MSKCDIIITRMDYYMKGYKFKPPTKFKNLNLIINFILIISVIVSMIFVNGIIKKSISLAIFLLFNGLWSINRKWYSLCHRDDKSYSVKYIWIIFIILGSALLIFDTVYFLL